MTTVLDTPASTPPATPPAPRLHGTGRVLAWIGGTLGILAIIWFSLDVASMIAREETSGEATHPARGVVELVADGRVTVTAAPAGTSTDEIHVARKAHFAFVDPKYSTTVTDDRTVVSYGCVMGWVWNCSTSLDVTLPAGTTVQVRTSDGDIRVQGVVGDVELRTSNGRVEASALGGDVIATSSNGDVRVVDAVGAVQARSDNGSVTVRGAASVQAHSSNGRVEVEDVAGEVKATSSNGDVKVADARSDITAESSNGDVRVYGTGEPVALVIDTSNGGRTVEAPTDPAAPVQVRIRSSNGSVSYLAPQG